MHLYESEDEDSGIRQRDLKARIIKKGLPIQRYKTPEELANLVLTDWTAIINQLYPPLEKFVSETCKLMVVVICYYNTL